MKRFTTDARVAARKDFMRTTKAQIALAGAALLGAGLLTGCSQQASAAETCEAPYASGALSKNVSVLGDFGSDPVVNVPEGFTYSSAQSYTVHKAKNRENAVTEPSFVSLNYAVFEAGNPEPLMKSQSFTDDRGYELMAVVPDAEQAVLPGGLICAAPGDRVVLTLSPEEAEMLSGGQTGQAGNPDAAYAVLVDVHDVQPIALDGKAKDLPAGFPGVVSNADGQPGVIATPAEAPTEVRKATRIESDGDEITAETSAVVNMMQVTWDGWRDEGGSRTRTPLVNTFAEQGPVEIGSEAQNQEPVRAALTGAKVGSQVVVIVPDDEYGATIYVVDILSGV